MRIATVKSLKDGDFIAMPIFNNDGIVILNAGVAVSNLIIQKMKQLGIDKVYIEDDRFKDVEVIPPIDTVIRTTAIKILAQAYNSLHKSGTVDESFLMDLSKKIVDNITDSKQRGASALIISNSKDIVEHSLNVAILTAFIAIEMGYNYGDLRNIVLGALIHDLGRLDEDDKEHVELGFKVMRRCRSLSLHSSIVCYEHHENFDGSGYPRGLQKEDISEFSRIIRVADYYENILRDTDKKLRPHEAFERVFAVAGQILDPQIIEKFRDSMVFFPNGSTVILSNKQQGVVIKQNHGSPARPVVRTFDDNGIIADIDLLKSLTEFIEDVLII